MLTMLYYITMQTSMGNSKYLTCKVVRSISLEFGVCEMNDKKMYALVNRLREYAIGIRMRDNETDEINDAKMIVE